MVDRGIPRHGYELVNAEGEQVGVVTSGTMSPTRKIGIGMGYVKPEYKGGYGNLYRYAWSEIEAVVVKPPFRKVKISLLLCIAPDKLRLYPGLTIMMVIAKHIRKYVVYPIEII